MKKSLSRHTNFTLDLTPHYKRKFGLGGSAENITTANLADDSTNAALSNTSGGKNPVGTIAGIEGMLDAGLHNAKVGSTYNIQSDIADNFGQALSNQNINTNDQLMEAWDQYNPMQHIHKKDVRGGSTLGRIYNTGMATVKGAEAGWNAGGQYGAILGAVVGLGTGVGGWLAGDRTAHKLRDRLNKEIDIANQFGYENLANQQSNVEQKNLLRAEGNYVAYGGPLDKRLAGHQMQDIYNNGIPSANKFKGGGNANIALVGNAPEQQQLQQQQQEKSMLDSLMPYILRAREMREQKEALAAQKEEEARRIAAQHASDQRYLDIITELQKQNALLRAYESQPQSQRYTEYPEVSDELFNSVAKFEGFSDTPVLDVNGYAIGYGNHDKETVDYYRNHPNERFSMEDAEKLAKRTLLEIRKTLASNIPEWDELSGPQQDALISYGYNTGPGKIINESPLLMKAISDKNWKDVAKHISRGWNQKDRKTGEILKGLRKRRNYERLPFLYPEMTQYGVLPDGTIVNPDSLIDVDLSKPYTYDNGTWSNMKEYAEDENNTIPVWVSSQHALGGPLKQFGDPIKEKMFREWYATWAAANDRNPDPDAKEHFYDYRGYWENNVLNNNSFPNQASLIMPNHLPDTYKLPGHPQMSVESKYWNKNKKGMVWKENPSPMKEREILVPETDQMFANRRYSPQRKSPYQTDFTKEGLKAFVRSKAKNNLTDEQIDALYEALINRSNWDPRMAAYVMGTESSFNTLAKNSGSSASGLGQHTVSATMDLYPNDYKEIRKEYDTGTRSFDNQVSDFLNYINKQYGKIKNNDYSYGSLKKMMLSPNVSVNSVIPANVFNSSLTPAQKKKLVLGKSTYADLINVYNDEYKKNMTFKYGGNLFPDGGFLDRVKDWAGKWKRKFTDREAFLADDYDSSKYTFDQAYADARKRGQRTFFWNNKYYNTDYEGVHGKKYKEDVKSGKAAAFDKKYPGFTNPELRREKEEELATYGITNEQTRNKSFIDRNLRKVLSNGYNIPEALSTMLEEYSLGTYYPTGESAKKALDKKYKNAFKDFNLKIGKNHIYDNEWAFIIPDDKTIKEYREGLSKSKRELFDAYLNDAKGKSGIGLGYQHTQPADWHRGEYDYLLGYDNRNAPVEQRPVISKYKTGSLPYYYTLPEMENNYPFYDNRIQEIISKYSPEDPFGKDFNNFLDSIGHTSSNPTKQQLKNREHWKNLGIDVDRKVPSIINGKKLKNASDEDLITLVRAGLLSNIYRNPAPGNYLVGSQDHYYSYDTPEKLETSLKSSNKRAKQVAEGVKLLQDIGIIPNSKLDLGKKGHEGNLNIIAPRLGAFTVGVPKDNSYLSIYDKFDIDPFGVGNQKTIFNVGKPYEYYTRLYPGNEEPDIDKLYSKFGNGGNLFKNGGSDNTPDRGIWEFLGEMFGANAASPIPIGAAATKAMKRRTVPTLKNKSQEKMQNNSPSIDPPDDYEYYLGQLSPITVVDKKPKKITQEAKARLAAYRKKENEEHLAELIAYNKRHRTGEGSIWDRKNEIQKKNREWLRTYYPQEFQKMWDELSYEQQQSIDPFVMDRKMQNEWMEDKTREAINWGGTHVALPLVSFAALPVLISAGAGAAGAGAMARSLLANGARSAWHYAKPWLKNAWELFSNPVSSVSKPLLGTKVGTTVGTYGDLLVNSYFTAQAADNIRKGNGSAWDWAIVAGSSLPIVSKTSKYLNNTFPNTFAAINNFEDKVTNASKNTVDKILLKLEGIKSPFAKKGKRYFGNNVEKNWQQYLGDIHARNRGVEENLVFPHDNISSLLDKEPLQELPMSEYEKLYVTRAQQPPMMIHGDPMATGVDVADVMGGWRQTVDKMPHFENGKLVASPTEILSKTGNGGHRIHGPQEHPIFWSQNKPWYETLGVEPADKHGIFAGFTSKKRPREAILNDREWKKYAKQHADFHKKTHPRQDTRITKPYRFIITDANNLTNLKNEGYIGWTSNSALDGGVPMNVLEGFEYNPLTKTWGKVKYVDDASRFKPKPVDLYTLE